MDLKEAHTYSSRHRDLIERSQACGCFYCLKIYPPREIKSWVDERSGTAVTAQCPFCGIDSVLPSAAGVPITPEFLGRMRSRWFSTPFDRLRAGDPRC